MLADLRQRLTRTGYKAVHRALARQAAFAVRLASSLLEPSGDLAAASNDADSILQDRFEELLERDLRNAEEGLYPPELLFSVPITKYARKLPSWPGELIRAALRSQRKGYDDLPGEVELEQYPRYYRRTFHWQTDGYLSKRSAELYDLAVELLFFGTADVMRRQVLAEITRFLGEEDEDGPARVLDAACGTGRLLDQLARSRDNVRLFGLDLSPFYIQEARETLMDHPNVSLVAENAEEMPFRDEYFDAVSSIYLFHELPRQARRNVVEEAFRVLRPGGLLVLEDSAQVSESPGLEPLLRWFPEQFHEPYYDDYLDDDLEVIAKEMGFEDVAVSSAYLSKVVTARRPA